jgi:hypothetical protein
MPRRKKSSAVEQPVGSTAPLKGALTQDDKDSPENLPLQMLVTRIEEMQHQQIQQTALMDKMLKATDANYKRILTDVSQQLERERRATEEGMAAMREEFQKHLEANRPSPNEQKNLVRQGLEDARKQIDRDKETFAKALKDMPKGTIYNDEGEPILFIICGHRQLLVPGENKGVPSVFIAEWEARKLQLERASNIDLAFQSRSPNGDLLDANAYNAVLGKQPVWDEDTGVVK